MTKRRNPDRRAVGLGLAAALSGIGSVTRLAAQESLPPPEGGIGGTGIVGLLASAGPFRINGISLEISDETRFLELGQGTIQSVFRPRDTVTVVARRSEDGGAQAVSIERVTPLIGTLEERGEGLAINGVAVVPEPGAEISARAGNRAAAQGVWDGPRVVATRVESAGEGPDVIAGTVDYGRGGASMAGIALDRPAWRLGVPDHGFLTIMGRFDEAGGFQVTRTVPRRFRNHAGQMLQALSVDGFLEPAERAPGFRIAGLGHSFDPAARVSALRGQRALFEGPYRGTFEVETALVLPARFDNRVALLDQPETLDRLGLR